MSIDSGHRPEHRIVAHPFDLNELLGPLAHRIANHGAPLLVLAELYGENGLDEVASSARISGGQLTRMNTMLAVLGGRRPYPASTPGHRANVLTVNGLADVRANVSHPLLIDALVAEASDGALLHGATNAALHIVDLDGEMRVVWTDDAPLLDVTVYSRIGRVQPGGRGGCGLGLAALAEASRQSGAFLSASGGPDKLALHFPS